MNKRKKEIERNKEEKFGEWNNKEGIYRQKKPERKREKENET